MVDHHPGAIAREGQGDGGADAVFAAGAGDDGDFLGEGIFVWHDTSFLE